MFIILSVLLAVAALFIVAYPILAKARAVAPARSSSQETLNELLARRDAAFQALRDLTFDHQVGKVSDEDFVVFEANLKQTAADALRALDEWEAKVDQDLALETEVGAGTASPEFNCPNCGSPVAPGDKFCATCGASLAPRTCPHCGRPYQPGDRFCAGCGQPLPAPEAPL